MRADFPLDMGIKWTDEFHEGVRYGLQGTLLIEEVTQYQKITIINSLRYGNALLLDNCWMTAEKQEKHYHESLVQPAMCSSKNIDKVLIIGGGDGGSARECLKHTEVKHVDLVEIDARVIELSKKHLKNIGGKAWKDPRLNIQINDGIKWVKESKSNSYDVIIVDGSEPEGHAEGLFNEFFFKECCRIMKKDGVFATQSESPEAFPKIHIETIKKLRKVFDYADPLYGSVPMYPSGWWSWTFASMHHPTYLNPLESRGSMIIENCHIWSPDWQKGAFNCMPNFIANELKK